MPGSKVTLFFRKLRETGNFSIEASFERMMASFPTDRRIELRKFRISYYSNGLIPRIRGVLEARRYAGDVNHVTGDVHYLVFGLKGRNTILTIHDCGLMLHPNPVARRILKWLWLDLPVRHCRYVTAVSGATKQDIIRYTGCSPEKVIVIPTVISGHYRRVERIFNKDCPRILHIGLAHNKNFERHVEALTGMKCRLHVVGKLEEWHKRLLSRYEVPYSYEYNISPEQMQNAYGESDILLFASTLEGFGMPIIEAQTVGIPVVTSDCSSMPEVSGGAACLVDPYDVASIRRGIRKVVEDDGYRDSLVAAGFRNVGRYSSETVARMYADLYQRLIS